jgi:hypothetical protein
MRFSLRTLLSKFSSILRRGEFPLELARALTNHRAVSSINEVRVAGDIRIPLYIGEFNRAVGCSCARCASG